ncbi:hypothetical protein D3877_10665 [Azospirillum cavernae]|uniref:Uncharacterized protein n=1 Tax=Azospirillum cavernae TaxID=2320860 RepID=A0A418W4H9_9PROT|nr:hypothetical protein [Azospirillum cavernae]RJF84922.1 hypothetical protein D3877_10665 [Azospirillum cavernae]
MGLRAVAQPLPVVKSWGSYGLSVDQTVGLGVNGPIRFDTVTGGNLGISAYTITLPQGRTFRLMSALSWSFSTGNAGARTSWYDVTAGTWIGTEAQHIPGTNTTPWTSQPVNHAIVSTMAGAVAVQLRINVSNSPSGVFRIASFAEVMEIG